MVSSYPFDGITACSNKSSRDYSFIPWSVHHFLAISGADIQVTYDVPDATWDDYVALRVLTGRDFDVEGLAVIDNTCGKKLNVSRPFSAPQSLRRLLIEDDFPAIIGDELMPAIFALNPSTGVVMSPFVRYARELFSSL